MEKGKHWKRIVYLCCMIQVGAGISLMGVMSFLPLFLSELGIRESGDAAFWAGLITGITPFMIALSAPFWSLETAKRGPRAMMTFVLASVTVCIVLSGLTVNPWQLLVLRAVQGLIGGFVPIGLAVVSAVTPERKTSWAMGYFQASMVCGIMFGPLLGGLIADSLGYRMPFFLFGGLSFLCLLAVRKYLPALDIRGEKKPGEKESAWAQILYFMKIPRVRIMTFIQFLCNFGITGIGPILPLYIQNEIGGGTTEMVATVVGIIIFMAGGFSAFASLQVGNVTKRIPIHRVLTGATFFVGFTFLCQYLAGSVYGLGFWRAVTGMGMGLIAPCTNTIIAQSVPPEKRTIVFGVVSSIFLMGNVAGPVCSGAVANWFSYSAVFWSTAAAFWFAAAVIFLNFRKGEKAA